MCDIYVGVWWLHFMEAFRKLEAYNLLFFANNNTKLRVSSGSLSDVSENLELSNRVFHGDAQTADFMGRDLKCGRKCIRSNAIGYENAVSLNRWSVFVQRIF